MSWILDTRGIDPTLIAGIFFIFTSYAVHPMVESAYHRVKAYFAWRALEKRQTVEVTNYPMLGEVLGARGKWDAGRVTTILLALFSFVCWGLELSVEFAHIEGLAYLLHQPPPVEVGVRDGLDVWLVKSRKELDYDGVWRHLPNVFRDFAKSRYYMDGSGRHSGTVNGNIIVASWYTEPDDTLFYFTGDKATAVDGLQCADEVPPKMVTVFHEGDLWGTAIECEKGPPLSSDLPLQHTDKNVPRPTVIMTGPKGKVFIVVKETSSYPNILYSTWTVGKANGTSVELQHLFHIATTIRLAEAVVTGIVHGETSGGGCFGLLRKFNENRDFDNSVNDNTAERAFVFGELSNRVSKIHMQHTERIAFGLAIHVNGLVCLACLVVIASIGVVSSICLHSSIDVDVYDSDDLVRAAVLSTVVTNDTQPTDKGVTPSSVSSGASSSATRIFVCKEDSGNVSVGINDATQRRCSPTVWSGLLALGSLALWEQELSMELAFHDGVADLPYPPPAVIVGGKRGAHFWQVTEPGVRGNDEYWRALPNTFGRHALWRNRMGNVGNDTREEVDGDLFVRYWDIDSNETFSHCREGFTTRPREP